MKPILEYYHENYHMACQEAYLEVNVPLPWSYSCEKNRGATPTSKTANWKPPVRTNDHGKCTEPGPAGSASRQHLRPARAPLRLIGPAGPGRPRHDRPAPARRCRADHSLPA
jgi:hypothetical protein